MLKMYEQIETLRIEIKNDSMKYDLIKASVKYNDMVGTMALDFKDAAVDPVKDILDEYDFDFDAYKIIAYSLSIPEATFEPFDISEDELTLTFHAVSKIEVGGSEEEIVNYASQNNRTLPVELFYVKITMQEFFDLLKRFKMTFTRDNTDRYFQGSYHQDYKEEHFLER